MDGEVGWDQKTAALVMNGIHTAPHDQVLRAFEGMCKDAGYSTSLKVVLASAGNRRADLEVFNILRVAQQTNLLVDVTLRHDFIGTGPRAASTATSCVCTSSSPISEPTTISIPSDINRTSKSSVAGAPPPRRRQTPENRCRRTAIPTTFAPG